MFELRNSRFGTTRKRKVCDTRVVNFNFGNEVCEGQSVGKDSIIYDKIII